jgi:ribonuclease VapC
MVVDTSALLAILFAEPERDDFAARLAEAGIRLVSALTLLEAAIVTMARKGPAGLRELDLLVHAARLEIVPFDNDQVLLARRAYEQFGRGRHPAGLNLGDCCAYALSRQSGEPMLFKGDDFRRTDVRDAREKRAP